MLFRCSPAAYQFQGPFIKRDKENATAHRGKAGAELLTEDNLCFPRIRGRRNPAKDFPVRSLVGLPWLLRGHGPPKH